MKPWPQFGCIGSSYNIYLFCTSNLVPNVAIHWKLNILLYIDYKSLPHFLSNGSFYLYQCALTIVDLNFVWHIKRLLFPLSKCLCIFFKLPEKYENKIHFSSFVSKTRLLQFFTPFLSLYFFISLNLSFSLYLCEIVKY